MKTAQQIIDQLPEQSRRTVLFSMVGSLNASVIGTASSVAQRLERSGYELRELEARDVIQLLNEMDDRQDLLSDARRTVRVAQNLRDQLIGVSNNDEDGSLSATLDFMTKGSGRSLDTELLKATLEAAGIKGVDPKHIEEMHRLNGVQRAAKLSAQRGIIEWLIEHVFSEAHAFEHDEEGRVEITDDIEDLSAEQRERVYNKLHDAIQRARDSAVLGVLNRDRRFTFSDLPLLSAALEEAEQLSAEQVATV